MVPRETPGITIRKIGKISCHHCESVEIFCCNVEVPKENTLGTRGNAFYEIMTVLNPERIGVAMMGVGIIAAIYELSFKYVQERNAFGGPIGRFQILQNYLADMYINLENSRNLTYKAAWLCDNGKPYHLEATMAKLVAAEGRTTCRDLWIRNLRRLRHMQRISRFHVCARCLSDSILAHLERDEPKHVDAVPGSAQILGVKSIMQRRNNMYTFRRHPALRCHYLA